MQNLHSELLPYGKVLLIEEKLVKQLLKDLLLTLRRLLRSKDRLQNFQYSFEPIPEGVDPNLILGNQANQWSEQIFDMRYAQYMTWPRGMAVAETGWSPKEKKNWNSFSKKVEQQFEKLDAANVRYARSMYDPIVTTELNTKGELIGIMEGEVEGLDMYYTINDQMPDNYSQKYTAPFLIPEDVLSLRVISYRDGKQIGKYLNIPIESLRKRAVKVL